MLKVGIAGYGVVGSRRRKSVDSHIQLRAHAVCDQKYGGSGTFSDGVKFFPHYRQLLEEDLDILFVCLPNDLAPEVTIAGLQKGLHVFCEKPPGKDISDIVRVIRCEREHPGLKLKYGFNHRYHGSVRDALDIVQSKELGELINLRGVYGKSKIIHWSSNWRSKRGSAGGGILLDQGIHMVDMMRLFAGEFVDIHSFVSNGFWQHDVEDNAYALMRTENNVVAFLHSSATQWRHRFQLDLTLTKGLVILSGILSGSKSYGAEEITVAYANEDDEGDPLEKSTRYNVDNSWGDEIASFVDAIRTDTPIDNGSSMDALKTMELVYRIYCADREWAEKFQLTDTVPEDVR